MTLREVTRPPPHFANMVLQNAHKKAASAAHHLRKGTQHQKPQNSGSKPLISANASSVAIRDQAQTVSSATSHLPSNSWRYDETGPEIEGNNPVSTMPGACVCLPAI